MTPDEIRQVIREALARIAPEVDLSTIDPTASLRDQVDLDSMDVLNFSLALHAKLGIEIPETDYPRLYSLDSAIRYLADRLARGAR